MRGEDNMPGATSIPEDRVLTVQECELVRWLLEHGNENAKSFLVHLESAKVISRCYCGCASINFAVANKVPTAASFQVLSDFQWESPEGHLFGVFVFARNDLLSGLEVWSIDGQSTPTSLPAIENLKPLGSEVCIQDDGPNKP